MNRKALFLSLGITAFVLVTAGGVLAAFAQSQSAPQPATIEDVLNDPEVQALLQEREAAYQQMIDEANQRLVEAEGAAEGSVAGEYPVPADLAVALGRIALDGGTLLRNPELVSVNGRAAYELIYDRGRVYVDATSGAILFNSSAGSSLVNSSPSSREHDDEGEWFDD
ncbi:MAG: hypothetical protein P8X64_08150 [Anaerolineales bacterium]|jgi:hypothetical protein